jgi:prepilin-type N-terminal cleavage/methylation domain-containing protein
MENKKAFTLIELLVVIAIIAILMAILMPALRAARSQARKTVCKVHVGGLALALRMYADDYEGKTHDSPNRGLWDNAHLKPAKVIPYGPDDSSAYWGIAYFPYAENKKIFSCPAVIRVDDWPEDGPNWGRKAQQYFKYCSYGLNSYIKNKNIDIKFRRPSEVIAFQDHIEQLLDGINSDMFCIGPSVNINLTQWRRSSEGGSNFVDNNWSGDQWHDTVQECFRHRRTSLTSWLDGHVSEIDQTTGEDVPCRWYTGEVENSM